MYKYHYELGYKCTMVNAVKGFRSVQKAHKHGRVMFYVTTDHLFQSMNAHVRAMFTFESELLIIPGASQLIFFVTPLTIHWPEQ